MPPANDNDEQEASDGDSDGSEKAITQMDPLELRFSQRKMRNVFQDGKLIDDSVDQVRPVRRSAEDAKIYGAQWRLEAPFPPIEVLRFRCKLRDETTGRPLIDPKTREERYEEEESWFTLDNRRLYCLQKAAAKLLPERATVDTVAEIRKERRMREIRKFRTLDNGKSIEVGSVVDGVPFQTWSWAAAAKDGSSGQASSKGKGSGRGRGKSDEAKGGGKGKGGKAGQNTYAAGGGWQEPWAAYDAYWGYYGGPVGGYFGYADYYGQYAGKGNSKSGSKGKGHGGGKGKSDRGKGGDAAQQWW